MNLVLATIRLHDYLNAESLLFAVGTVIFAVWLLRTSLGRKALINSRPHRNRINIVMPFAVLLFWTLGIAATSAIAEKITGELSGGTNLFLITLIQACGSAVAVVVVIFLVRNLFARRLRGFGLSASTLGKDLLIAPVNLLAVWPIVAAVLLVTIQVGKLLFGHDFQLEPHQELQHVREYADLQLHVMIFINGAIITPIFEEVLFRGLFHNLIRSYVPQPWPALVASSLIFTIAHVNPQHWPALFVLGMIMGYAYEKSDSLLRPMLIHGLFNGLVIAGTILADTAG